jgi:ABC-type multidrug transport system ATPase subunit
MASSMKALEHLGLGGLADSSGIGLSLGESKRVALARALATGARIIVLDEPLSGLDYEGVRSFIRTLEAVSEEKGIVLLISEHVLNVPHVLPIATDVWTLADGKIRTETAESVRSAYPEALSKAFVDLLRAGVDVDRHNLPGGANLTVLSDSDVGQPTLEMNDVVVKRGSRLIPGATGVSITLRAGQTGILEAPNGWGKSSLMLAAAGVVPVIRGSIHIMGQCVDGLPTWKRARLGLGMLQSRDSSFPDLSVRDVLQLSKVSQSVVDSALLNRQVATLSGGERQKLSLICFRDRKSSVALLDEPWTALDERGIEMAREIMIPRRGVASLISVPTGYEEPFEL